MSMERKNVKRFLLNGQRAAVRNGFSPFPKRGDEEEIRRYKRGKFGEREKVSCVFFCYNKKPCHFVCWFSFA